MAPLVLLALSLVFSIAESAVGESCRSAFAPAATTEQHHGTQQELAATFKNLYDNLDDSLTGRGFVGRGDRRGPAIPVNPEAIEAGLVNGGFVNWALRIIVVESLDAAIAHRIAFQKHHIKNDSLDTVPANAPLYLIGRIAEFNLPDYTLPEHSKTMYFPVQPAALEPLLAKGGYEIDAEGRPTAVSAERIARYVSTEVVLAIPPPKVPDSVGSWTVSIPGYASMKIRGVHDFPAWAETKDGKKLRAYTMKLLDQGYTFFFNRDPIAALDFLRNEQVRSKRDDVVNEKGETTQRRTEIRGGRYDQDQVYNAMLAELRSGKGYSVEGYDPVHDQISSGEVGFQRGSHFLGDSVLYREVRHAKASFYTFAKALAEKGIAYTDSGMITPYSRDNGAIPTESKKAMELFKTGPQDIKLSGSFDIRTPEHFAERFKSLAAARNQAFGVQKFISRLPVPPLEADKLEMALQSAKTQKIVRKPMRLIFVSSLAEAQAHAAAVADTSNMPVYVVSKNSALAKQVESQSPAAILKELLVSSGDEAGLDRWLGERSAPLEAAVDEVIQFSHPRFVFRDMAYAKASLLTEKLELEFLGDKHIAISKDGGHTVFSIDMWSLE